MWREDRGMTSSTYRRRSREPVLVMMARRCTTRCDIRSSRASRGGRPLPRMRGVDAGLLTVRRGRGAPKRHLRAVAIEARMICLADVDRSRRRSSGHENITGRSLHPRQIAAEQRRVARVVRHGRNRPVRRFACQRLDDGRLLADLHDQHGSGRRLTTALRSDGSSRSALTHGGVLVDDRALRPERILAMTF